jgi:hypothetical protein
MALSPTEIVAAILDNPTDLDHVRSLVTDDVTYVSLNYDDPDLKRIMPWCGTSKGPESIVKTFVDVGRYWEKQAFAVEALFGSGENVAMFGRFTYKIHSARQGRDFSVCHLRQGREWTVHIPAVRGRHFRDGRFIPKRRQLDVPKQSER